MHNLNLALVLLLLGGLLPLLFSRSFRLAKGLAIVLTSGGCVSGLYSVLTGFSGNGDQLQNLPVASVDWLGLFPLSFVLDPLSAFFLVVIFLISPLAALYCYEYLDHRDEYLRTAFCCLFFNLLVISMALVVMAENVVSFFLAWELMSLSSFFLVLYDYQTPETRKAAYIYLIFTHLGGLSILAGFGFFYGITDQLDFAEMWRIPEGLKSIVFCILLVGFGSKAGVYPLHIWLPHAHPAAPSHVSAVMSGVMIKMGIYGIVRCYLALAPTGLFYGEMVLALGIISGILGVAYALGKHDLKRLLAYHSVENIGIILIGCGVGMIGLETDDWLMAGFGFAGGLLHVLNHSIFKSLLFLGAGAVLKKSGTRHIDQLGGVLKSMPITGSTFLTGSISISGLPPFNGFVSEILIYCGAFHGLVLGGLPFVLICLAILALAMIGGLAAACFSKVVGIVFLGEPRSRKAERVVEAGWTMTLPMILLALVCCIIGVFPEVVVEPMVSVLGEMIDRSVIPRTEMVAVTGGIGNAARILLVGIAVVWCLQKLLLRRRKVARNSTWGCGFTRPTPRIQYTGTSYADSLVGFFRPFVQVVTSYPGIKGIFPKSVAYNSHVDDRAEIVLREDLVGPLLHLMGKFRWIQHGHIQLYIGYIIATIVVLLLFVR